MGVYRQPPPPFMGGRQPHEPRELPVTLTAVQVNQPPYQIGGPYAIKHLIVMDAQPQWGFRVWPYVFMGARQPYAPARLSPGIPGQSVDAPPTQLGGPIAIKSELALIAQPNPWVYTFHTSTGVMPQPYAPRLGSPGIPGASVEEPPHMLGGPYAIKSEIVASTQADWRGDRWPYVFAGGKQPYDVRKLSAGIPGQSVDQPPSSLGGPIAIKMLAPAINAGIFAPWPYLFHGGKAPYDWRKSPLLGVPVNDPPFTLGGPVTIKQQVVAEAQPQWGHFAWPYVFMGARQPYAPARIDPQDIAVPVNNPPPSHRARTELYMRLVLAWERPAQHTFQLTLYASHIFPRDAGYKPSARGYIIL